MHCVQCVCVLVLVQGMNTFLLGEVLNWSGSWISIWIGFKHGSNSKLIDSVLCGLLCEQDLPLETHYMAAYKHDITTVLFGSCYFIMFFIISVVLTLCHMFTSQLNLMHRHRPLVFEGFFFSVRAEVSTPLSVFPLTCRLMLCKGDETSGLTAESCCVDGNSISTNSK